MNAPQHPPPGAAARGPVVSVMLAVPSAPAAVGWYQSALGATTLWDLGGVAALEIGGAAFLVGEPEPGVWESPDRVGATTCRVEVFWDDPDDVVARALAAGATEFDPVRDRAMPWGAHRQGAFVDPFGHVWFVGDRSPLRRFP